MEDLLGNAADDANVESVDDNMKQASEKEESGSFEYTSDTPINHSDDENEDDASDFNPAEMPEKDDTGSTTTNHTQKSSHGGDNESVASSFVPDSTCFHCMNPIRDSVNFIMKCACCTQQSEVCKGCVPKVVELFKPQDYFVAPNVSSLLFNQLKFPMFCSKCRQDCFWCKETHEGK